MATIQLNHLAVLTNSVEKASVFCKKLNFEMGPIEDWEGEGTKKLYVGSDLQTNRLLLMEPVQAGAYQRALVKRGPGLHHIAIDVLDVESFVADLAGSGWYMHPNSLKTCKKTQTVWLARPGMEILIEVQQRKSFTSLPRFISKLEMPLSKKGVEMMAAIGLGQFVSPCSSGSRLTIGDVSFQLQELF